MLKKLTSVIIMAAMIFSAGYSAGAQSPEKEIVCLPFADTYVSLAQPDTNYGEDASAKIATYSDTARNIPYYSFQVSADVTDDAKINENTMENNGLWYSFDVTSKVKELRKSGLPLNVGVWIPWEANTDYSGVFNTKESSRNLPHLKISFGKSGEVLSAKIYLFGGAITRKIEMYETAGVFDEKLITYNKRPQLEELISKAQIEYEMSGEERDEAVSLTYEGLDISVLNKTKMGSFHGLCPEYPKWDDIYDARLVPDVEKLEADWRKTLPDKSHPRIYGNPDDWKKVRALISRGNEEIIKWRDRILSMADIALKRGKPVYKIRASGDIDNCGADIPSLGLAYQITGDTKYSDACCEYMKAVASYRDWNSGGMSALNIGACSTNVGLGYDLVYYTLSQEDKNEIVRGAVKNGFNVMLGAPNTNTNNWNTVINGGISVLACAMLDEETQTGLEIVRQSIANIPISLAEYYPDGGFPEGPSYWAYMLDNFINFLAAVNYTFGSDYGIGDFQGISTTGFYPIYIQGPNSSIRYKYGDDRTANIASKSLFYLARRFNNPVFASYQLSHAGQLDSYETIAPYWYCGEDVFGENKASVYENIPRDKVFNGQSPIGTMRSNWDDENALFTGFKAGFPQTSHADMDIGTFTFAANGVEWACELKGSSEYVHPGYHSLFRLSRYLYYERGVQGHNTLLFNPGRTYPNIEFGQEADSYSVIEKYDFTPGQAPYAILNISDAYRRYATSVRRGISLINNRREFLVQDEISCAGNNTVYWFMHTKADIETKGNEAILTQGDKKLYCKIISPANAEFDVMDAKPMPMTATAGGYDFKNNLDYKKLSVKCDIQNKDTIAVWMVPLVHGDEIPDFEPVVKPLNEWPHKEKENVCLDDIKINGKSIPGFKPDKYVYNYESDSGNFDYQIETPDDVNAEVSYANGYLRIECTDKNGVRSSSRYLVAKTEKARKSSYKITASEIPESANGPAMSIDGDFDTRYASEGKQWILYDLEEPKTLDHLMLAFYNGNTRRYNFGIELSNDGENYVKVYDGRTSGTTSKFETYMFEKTEARYVKITFNGNNENNWNNLSEIYFGFIDDGSFSLNEFPVE